MVLFTVGASQQFSSFYCFILTNIPFTCMTVDIVLSGPVPLKKEFDLRDEFFPLELP